jgi:hypothetical protein
MKGSENNERNRAKKRTLSRSEISAAVAFVAPEQPERVNSSTLANVKTRVEPEPKGYVLIFFFFFF